MISHSHTSKIMITLFVEENNPLTPTFYDSFITDLQFHQLRCPCDRPMVCQFMNAIMVLPRHPKVNSASISVALSVAPALRPMLCFFPPWFHRCEHHLTCHCELSQALETAPDFPFHLHYLRSCSDKAMLYSLFQTVHADQTDHYNQKSFTTSFNQK